MEVIYKVEQYRKMSGLSQRGLALKVDARELFEYF